MAASVSSVACARAAVALNSWRLYLMPPGQRRRAEHQQNVADDRAGQRGLHHRVEPLSQRHDGDDQLRRVAEGGVQKPADAFAGVVRSCSVACPSQPARGTIARQEAMKIQVCATGRQQTPERWRPERRSAAS